MVGHDAASLGYSTPVFRRNCFLHLQR